MPRKHSAGDNLKGAWRSIVKGTALNPISTMREINAAHDERAAFERVADGWYTQYKSANDSVHLLLDRNQRITTQRPHVHVIHDGSTGFVEIILTDARGRHEPSRFVDIDAGAAVIEKAIAMACARLPHD